MPTATMTNADLLKRREAAIPRGPFNVAPIFADRAEGSRIWDVEGNEFLDFCGGIGCVNVGHNHPRVVAAVKAQADRFLHTCWHVAMYEDYVRLCERLNALAPVGGRAKTALFNSGAEAGENAVKICRAYTKRPAVIAFERGFHGRTLLGMTMTGKCKPYTAGFGPFAPEIYRLPVDAFFAPADASATAVEKAARHAIEHLFAYHVEPEAIACVIAEPVLGEGGFHPMHPAAMRLLTTVCREHGIVYVSDEVQSGFGRAGAMFACERYGIQPDMIAMAKSLAGGTVLSAVTARAEIMDAPGIGGIGGTFGGNPMSCAAANAVLDVMEEEELPARANRLGDIVMARFRAMTSKHDTVANPRGLGAMCAFDLVNPETKAVDAARANRVVLESRNRGLLVMTASGHAIRTLFPLTIAEADLARGLDILEAAVAAAV